MICKVCDAEIKSLVYAVMSDIDKKLIMCQKCKTEHIWEKSDR